MDIDKQVLEAFSVTPITLEASAIETPKGFDASRSREVRLKRRSGAMHLAHLVSIQVFYKNKRKVIVRDQNTPQEESL